MNAIMQQSTPLTPITLSKSPLASSQTLFESFHPLSDQEYAAVSQFLTLFISASSVQVTNRSIQPDEHAAKAQMLAPHLMDVVYSIVKYGPHIEQIILSSEILAACPDLVPHISLLKVILFQLMANHFNTDTFSERTESNTEENSLVQWVIDMVIRQRTKIHASYARLRIEYKAYGSDDTQRLMKLVDWTKPDLAGNCPVAFRVRVLPNVLMDALTTCLPEWDTVNDILWDSEQSDLVRIPYHLVPELLVSPLVVSESLVLQDPCASLPVQIILDWLVPRLGSRKQQRVPIVLDTKASNEIRLKQYQEYGNDAAQYMFTAPISPSFNSQTTGEHPKIPWSGCTKVFDNTTFMDVNVSSNGPNPDIILVEPDNSQSAVLEEKYFLMQERTIKPDLTSPEARERLITHQRNMLAHALEFESARFIVYVTRSVDKDENQDVINVCLSNAPDWQIMTVQELEAEEEQKECESSNFDNVHLMDADISNKTMQIVANDSGVFENENDDGPLISEPDPDNQHVALTEDDTTSKDLDQCESQLNTETPFILINPNPPMVTCGMFIAVLQRKHIDVDETEQHESELGLDRIESPQVQQRPRTRRRKGRKELRSIRAWRHAIYGKNMKDLQVIGVCMNESSHRPFRSHHPTPSILFPNPIPWK